MIADTTFASTLFKEQRRGKPGAATAFLRKHRSKNIRLTIITAGEISVLFPTSAAAHQWLDHWTIYRLHMGVMDVAADIDRRQIKSGQRLGENDNWIAGFAIYYREPVISLDAGFDRVPGLRRIAY